MREAWPGSLQIPSHKTSHTLEARKTLAEELLIRGTEVRERAFDTARRHPAVARAFAVAERPPLTGPALTVKLALERTEAAQSPVFEDAGERALVNVSQLCSRLDEEITRIDVSIVL